MLTDECRGNREIAGIEERRPQSGLARAREASGGVRLVAVRHPGGRRGVAPCGGRGSRCAGTGRPRSRGGRGQPVSSGSRSGAGRAAVLPRDSGLIVNWSNLPAGRTRFERNGVRIGDLGDSGRAACPTSWRRRSARRALNWYGESSRPRACWPPRRVRPDSAGTLTTTGWRSSANRRRELTGAGSLADTTSRSMWRSPPAAP